MTKFREMVLQMGLLEHHQVEAFDAEERRCLQRHHAAATKA